MKYLGIHKILWYLIVVVYTLFQFVFLYLPWNIIRFIWCFKWNITWESLITYRTYQSEDGYMYEEDVPYGDKNIFQTIIRRCKCDFK